MQDVGVRLYTFIWTMFDVMEAGFMLNAEVKSSIPSKTGRGVQVLVCDRPNPLGGLLVDGPLLNMSCCSSGYGKSAIPHIHGMTIGELSLLFHRQLSDRFPSVAMVTNVVGVVGYERSMSWLDTGLPWIPPSPNVRQCVA